ncbi:hypothetical protein A0H81_07350 [Grifola frondosa]|uniref:Uncharacterized protein n=1 Tax=Grifola frondosa TaxID=5627 RepID=A0A1C7M8J9_GRIFR|nr:hypothetical protein A0H81_07350 [Grifola frondosa]
MDGGLERLVRILHDFLGPSIGANGMPRETREQRLARRQAQTEMRQREQVAALARALERQVADEPIQTESAADTSAETSSNATPIGSNTPTGSVVVPGRDRSGTIIARPIWDQPQRRAHRSRPTVQAASQGASTSTSAANSRPETETEDDGDVDMDRASSRDGDGSSPDPTRGDNGTVRGARRAVGIVSDTTAPAAAGASLEMNTDAHIIINDQGWLWKVWVWRTE